MTKLINDLGVISHGVNKGLPRYYKDLIKKSNLSLEYACDLFSSDLIKFEDIPKTSIIKKNLVKRARLQHQKDVDKFLEFKSAGLFFGDYDSWKKLNERQKYLSAEAKTSMYRKGDF